MIPTVTPEWLSDRLRSRGALPTGRVTAVLPGNADSDKILPFQVLYSPEAPDSAPERLLLKVNLNGGLYGIVETRLYDDFQDTPSPPLPPTYETGIDSSSSHSYLLQQDLSETHHLAVTDENPPTIDALGAIVDQIARVHAFYWDRPATREACFVTPRQDITAMCIAAKHEELTESVEHVIPRQLQMIFTSKDLDPSWKSICEHAMRAWPALYDKRISKSKLTLIHGDLHPWNILVPNEGNGLPLIFDWELLCRGLGVYDLCYLILRCRLDPEERRRFEAALIPRYQNRLVELGVVDYSLDACHQDYRLAIIPNILPPLAWQRPHNLVATMEAFFDWNCEELYHPA